MKSKKISKIATKIICDFADLGVKRLNFATSEETVAFYEWFDGLNPESESDVEIFKEKVESIISLDASEKFDNNEELNKKILFKKLNIIKHIYSEISIDGGKVYLDSIPVSVPMRIVEEIVRRFDANEHLEPLLNFWRWLMLNPDSEAREGAYRFIQDLNLSLTLEGFFVAYRSVKIKQKNERYDVESLIKRFEKIEARFKEKRVAERKLHVYKMVTDEKIKIVVSPVGKQMYDWVKLNKRTLILPDSLIPQNDILEKLSRDEEKTQIYYVDYYPAFKRIFYNDIKQEEELIFTDAHTGKMTIRMNVPVSLPRSECDNNPNQSCSRGLHVGSENFAIKSFGNYQIQVLINPMNIVAVPHEYGNSYKMRVCEYLPFGEVEYNEEGKIIPPGITVYTGISKYYNKYNKDHIRQLLQETSFEEKVEYKLFNQMLSDENIENIIKKIRNRILSRKEKL